MTKVLVDSQGKVLTSGENAIIASGGGGGTTLYCWQTNKSNYVYVLNANPAVGDTFYTGEIYGNITSGTLTEEKGGNIRAGSFGLLDIRYSAYDITF